MMELRPRLVAIVALGPLLFACASSGPPPAPMSATMSEGEIISAIRTGRYFFRCRTTDCEWVQNESFRDVMESLETGNAAAAARIVARTDADTAFGYYVLARTAFLLGGYQAAETYSQMSLGRVRIVPYWNESCNRRRVCYRVHLPPDAEELHERARRLRLATPGGVDPRGCRSRDPDSGLIVERPC